MRRPGDDARPTLTTGDADARLCTGRASQSASFAICGRRNESWVTPHWPMDGEQVPTRQFLEFAWQESGASGGLRFSEPLDLTSDRLELRTISDPTYADPDVQVRISDSSGGSAVLEPEPGTEPTKLPEISYATKLWATAVVVDASGAAGVDLTDITSVELVAGTPRGRVWIADLSSAPETVAPVADRRLPQVRDRQRPDRRGRRRHQDRAGAVQDRRQRDARGAVRGLHRGSGTGSGAAALHRRRAGAEVRFHPGGVRGRPAVRVRPADPDRPLAAAGHRDRRLPRRAVGRRGRPGTPTSTSTSPGGCGRASRSSSR